MSVQTASRQPSATQPESTIILKRNSCTSHRPQRHTHFQQSRRQILIMYRKDAMRTQRYTIIVFYRQSVLLFCHLIKRLWANMLYYNILAHIWSGLLDSNQRPLRPERSALPTALNPEALKASAKVQHFFETRALFSKKMLKNLYS